MPIEVFADRHAPLGMPPARFLREYWQQRPLLIRRAFAHFKPPIDANDLAGLACESVASARIVSHDRQSDRWTLETGPFEETQFETLPDRDWTLLVQDCDKLLGEVDALLAAFRFLPDWRVDDVMVSFAAPGGSVGAHVDHYDVFLLQGDGRRRWQIDTASGTGRAYRDDADLKVLREFAPTHEWVLETGDMLYLPPDVPHHGVAVEACTTFSIGMRAPAIAELLVDAAEFAAERSPEGKRLRVDSDAAPRDSACIPESVVHEVRSALRAATQLTDLELADWFGGFITRYRAAHEISAPPRTPALAQLKTALRGSATLHRHPWSRYAWQLRGKAGARLHFAGESFDASVKLARILQAGKRYSRSHFANILAPDWQCVHALVSAGHLVLDADQGLE